MSTKTKTPSKRALKLQAEAIRQARREAECNIQFGWGTISEAVTAHNRFREAFPSLAPHITRTRFVLTYVRHEMWVNIRALPENPNGARKRA